MTHDNGQRSLGVRVLIAVGAMLGASVAFVGAVMLLLSFIVDHAVNPSRSLPASDDTAATSEHKTAPTPGLPKTKSASRSSEAKAGDRS